MKLEKRSYRLTGLSPLLGSSPADPDVYTNYIASRAPADFTGMAEVDALPEYDGNKGLTVFLRDPETDALCVRNHQVVGFFKESIEALKSSLNVLMARSKVDRYVFVDPIWLPITKDGQEVMEEDSVYERPLRARTMQGDRVALASSEQVDRPWSIEFEVLLLENEATKKSDPVTWKAIEMALDYGRLKGLGQYRNGSFGRFKWERVD